MLIVTAAEMAQLDREVIDDVGVPGAVLMDAAGRGVAEVVARALAEASPRSRTGADVVVYAGAGNNGGDGLVCARWLFDRGIAVEVILCAPQQKLKGDALIYWRACQKIGIPLHDGASPEGLAAAAQITRGARVVVDALFGTGLDRPVEGHFADAIALVDTHPGIKVAVDIPSGLDADRGVPLGACVRAHHTVTFAFPKRGLVSAPGFTYAGRLHVVDIGISESRARARGVLGELLDEGVLEALRAPRDPLGHKGSHGHLLILAGSVGKSGAALLCGGAALRLGAGLVTLAAPRALQPVVEGRVFELMTSFYDDPAEVVALLDGKRALAIGPGMPTDAAMRSPLRAILRGAAERGLAIVVDADGLNHLAADASLLDGIPGATLTPHPGEAARLLGCASAEVQSDRIGAAARLAAQFEAVVALKGARTVVAAPDGRIAVCPTGNPHLGTGGTGDVLTGMVGALGARGMAAWEAACAAVYLHGAAGDRLVAERGSLVAHEIAEMAPLVLRR